MKATCEITKRAITKSLYVGFAEVRNGEVVYRDGIRANSVEEAIASRWSHLRGKLPEGFIIEKVVR